MNIDFSQLVTVEAKRAMDAESRLEAARAECRRRILQAVGSVAQMNLMAAASADMLTPAQMADWAKTLEWISRMRGAWREIAQSDVGSVQEANWPPMPDETKRLVEGF
ncbi:hypothetical protein [Ruegeria sp. PrR005]|uniref:Tail fiber assembly protein n=1 Tax=Ruegeria sp. PrR005 TaxID=2706882 RepID=A0A6B2NM22_9RHOB|nr:hypothetical protein [Ruegeria sp. PrR005]NDW44270.1 hypothetical protein [Ruegeria sp. PrR005]